MCSSFPATPFLLTHMSWTCDSCLFAGSLTCCKPLFPTFLLWDLVHSSLSAAMKFNYFFNYCCFKQHTDVFIWHLNISFLFMVQFLKQSQRSSADVMLKMSVNCIEIPTEVCFQPASVDPDHYSTTFLQTSRPIFLKLPTVSAGPCVRVCQVSQTQSC